MSDTSLDTEVIEEDGLFRFPALMFVDTLGTAYVYASDLAEAMACMAQMVADDTVCHKIP